jgi:hydroxymethylbilane synthase
MATNSSLRLGTRSSALARWQADWVAARLAELGSKVELVFITTEGDVKTGPLGAIGGQGLFTKQIQQALLDNRIDLAVHSLKDLPTEPVPGLALAAVPVRENPQDVLVSKRYKSLDELPQRARLGTGSMRRKAQLLNVRPDLQIGEIRGNVDTRLRKLDAGEFDAIVLAQAGLVRLGCQQRIAQVLPPSVMLPAVGQGALGIEVRAEDVATLKALAPLNHAPSRAAVLAERTMLAELRGGCLAPVGAWARVENDRLLLDGVVVSADGRRRLATSAAGSTNNPEAVGKQVAKTLLGLGAEKLIAAARS